MNSRHKVIVNHVTRHFLMMLTLVFDISHIYIEQKLCENIFCRDLTRKMQFENSRLDLELKICLIMSYREILKLKKFRYYNAST